MSTWRRRPGSASLPARQAAFAAVSTALGLAAALALAEIGLRAAGIGYGNSPMESHPVLHHAHPRNYTFLAHTPDGEYGGFHVHYDAEARRAAGKDDRAPPAGGSGDCRIAFLGDSFTEATQVPYAATFVGLIARQSACEVRNYGVSSYSPVLYLVQWRHEVRHFRPSLVVVQLYANDIAGDAELIGRSVRDPAGMPVAIPGPPDDIASRLFRRSYVARLVRMAQLQLQWRLQRPAGEQPVVGRYVEENPDITELSAGLMGALVDEVRAAAADVAVFVVPSKHRLGRRGEAFSDPEHSDKWKAWAGGRGDVAFIDLPDAFRGHSRGDEAFFRLDIHFARRGHEITALALCETLQSRLGIAAACNPVP